MNDNIELFTPDGSRKYLNPSERIAFIDAANKCPDTRARTLCLVLAYTGCRISEALELTSGSIDMDAKQIIIKTLKKKSAVKYRLIPAPSKVLDALDLVHGIRAAKNKKSGFDALLWPISRATAWRRVKAVMDVAGFAFDDVKATPKGLRHGFAVKALMADIPLTTVQTWLGHASLDTTAIYLQVTGAEDRTLARRMWDED